MQMTLGTKLRLAGYAINSLILKPKHRAYNPRSKDCMNNIRSIYEGMFQEKNMFWSPYTMGWHAGGDVSFMEKWLKDDRLSSSIYHWQFAPIKQARTDFEQMITSQLMILPEIDHRRVRRLVSSAFSPRFVESIREPARQLIVESIDAVDKDGVINASTLCHAIPARVLAMYVGVPPSAFDDFNALGQSVLASFDTTNKPDIDGANRGIAQLKALMKQKRENPDDSFLSTLVNHVEDGDRITEMEAVSLLASLFAAGVDTTGTTLVQAIYAMSKHLGWASWLHEHPTCAFDVLSEGVRWCCGTHRGLMRFAKENVQINENTVRKGEMVQFMLSSSNFDPVTYNNPWEYDPTRSSTRKVMMFGEGAHYCLGHALARMICETTLLALVERYQDISVLQEPTLHYEIMAYPMKDLLIKGEN